MNQSNKDPQVEIDQYERLSEETKRYLWMLVSAVLIKPRMTFAISDGQRSMLEAKQYLASDEDDDEPEQPQPEPA